MPPSAHDIGARMQDIAPSRCHCSFNAQAGPLRHALIRAKQIILIKTISYDHICISACVGGGGKRLVRRIFMLMVTVGAARGVDCGCMTPSPDHPGGAPPSAYPADTSARTRPRRDKVIVFVHSVIGDEKATEAHRD